MPHALHASDPPPGPVVSRCIPTPFLHHPRNLLPRFVAPDLPRSAAEQSAVVVSVDAVPLVLRRRRRVYFRRVIASASAAATTATVVVVLIGIGVVVVVEREPARCFRADEVGVIPVCRVMLRVRMLLVPLPAGAGRAARVVVVIIVVVAAVAPPVVILTTLFDPRSPTTSVLQVVREVSIPPSDPPPAAPAPFPRRREPPLAMLPEFRRVSEGIVPDPVNVILGRRNGEWDRRRRTPRRRSAVAA